MLFINASEQYEKGKRQNTLREGSDGEPNDIQKIVDTYKYRPEQIERYARSCCFKSIMEIKMGKPDLSGMPIRIR